MGGYNFSIPGARENIENGTKVLTMRRDRKDGWLPEVGEVIKLTDGSRWVKAGEPGSIQPIYINGKNPTCTGVWPVILPVMGNNAGCEIITDFFFDMFNYKESTYFPDKFDGIKNKISLGEKMHGLQNKELKLIRRFATMDGWSTAGEMFQFFKDHYGLPVKLNLIYWGPR